MPIGDIALSRQSRVFVKVESNAGTLVEPTDTDLILATVVPDIKQERQTHDDMQIRNSRSKLSPIAGRYTSGTWSFTTYIKPSGTAGTAPPEDVLLTGLLGTKTVTPATSVAYSLSSNVPNSYSIWFKDGHTVYMCSGASINQGVFNISGNEPGTADWSGGFMKLLWTGTSTLGAAIGDTTSTSITVANGKLFSNGSIFTVDSERFKVTADPAGSSTLTVTRGYGGTSAATHANSSTITPWLPSGTEAGNVVHGRLGICTLDSTSYNVLSSAITISNNIKYYEEEKNGQDYATEFGIPESRTVEASVSLYFRKGDTQRFYDALQFSNLALVVPIGNTSGKIVTISMPQCKIPAPAISGDAERMQELQFMPFGTVAGGYDNEITVTYT